MFSSARRQIFFPEKLFGDSLKNLAKLLRLWYAVGAKSFKAVPNAAPAGQAPQELRGTVTPGKVRNFMKKKSSVH